MMDPERWARVQSVFHDALELPAHERPDFVQRACDGDERLASDVLAMIAEDERRTGLLERGLGAVAHDLVNVPLAPGQIGPYRIVGEAGRGGMGVVYLAERSDLGSRAAIKLLQDATLSPLRRERFAAEQRILARLEHPGIARLYDADVLADGTPYIVMEYVEGVPLTTYAASRQLSLKDRLQLFLSVCDAVQYAHGQAVIHLDLKPSNILVRSDGTVKLLDFGIARQLETLESRKDRTQTIWQLMTPAYAAPEQLARGTLGTHTDVYALGVILYELLTGQAPFDRNLTPRELETAILEGQVRRPSQLTRPDAGDGKSELRNVRGRAARADLDALCLTAMHVDPKRRYPTVNALARDVMRFLAYQPLDARPDSAAYRLNRFLRRNRRSVAVAALLATVLIGFSIFHTLRITAARDAAVAEAARTQRVQQFMLGLFEGGDAAAGPADTLRVLSLVDRGLAEARVLDAAPDLQAEMFTTLGGIYQKLGRMERADSLLKLSLARRQSVLGASHADVAASLSALASLRMEEAEHDEAERLIRDALAMNRQHLPPRHPSTVEALTLLGTVLQRRGDYDEAIGILEEALALQPPDASPSLANTLNQLANTHFYKGNLATSDSLNRRVLALSRQLFGERHPAVADDLINLGAIEFERARYPEAEQLYRQGLAIKQDFYGSEHPQTAAAMTMLARALVALNRESEALTQLQPALRIRERTYGPAHPRVAATLNELGAIALRQRDFAAARSYFSRMQEIYEKIYADQHYLTALALSNLASVHMEAGDLGLAERTFNRAVAIYTATLSADHLNTGIARIKLGRALTRQQRYREAEPHLRQGYDIVAAKAQPGVSWLQSARIDLSAVYEALGQTQEAARWRAEHARHAPPDNQ
jgi:serine/threonine-protein kinase